MSVYKFETKSLEFSWNNDKSVTVRHKDVTLVQKGINITTSSKGFDIYYLKANPVGVKINDFNDQKGDVINDIIAGFVPIERNYLRHELIEGLRYYKTAITYKVLVPGDIAAKKLEAISKDYKNITNKMPEFLNELQDMENKALECHVSEPLVASTGLMVYETREVTWLIHETTDKFDDRPEYINQVDYRDKAQPNAYYVKVRAGTQQECIAFILEEQKKFYGFSISDLIQKRNDRDMLMKSIKELELLLKISNSNSWTPPDEKPTSVNPLPILDKYTANLTQQ